MRIFLKSFKQVGEKRYLFFAMSCHHFGVNVRVFYSMGHEPFSLFHHIVLI